LIYRQDPIGAPAANRSLIGSSASDRILKLQFILNIYQICNYSLENITFKKQGMRPDSLYRQSIPALQQGSSMPYNTAAASWLSVTQHITHDQGGKENSRGLDPK
jgi:hypothetical protein